MRLFVQETTTTDSSAGIDLNQTVTGVLIFAGAAVLVFAVVYAFGRWRFKSTLNITFARLYALMVIATLAVVVTFADVPTEAKTAAFALLGTIAGYLAGARPSEVETTDEDGTLRRESAL